MLKILVPLDGSECGEAALPSVAEMAASYKAQGGVEVVLLQVITQLNHWSPQNASEILYILYSPEEMDRIRQHSQRYLEQAAAHLREKGITVSTKVCTGNAAEQIINTCKECGANLIAMSTHGRSGISRWAMGSVTDKVLREGSIPTLVVRPKEAHSTRT